MKHQIIIDKDEFDAHIKKVKHEAYFELLLEIEQKARNSNPMEHHVTFKNHPDKNLITNSLYEIAQGMLSGYIMFLKEQDRFVEELRRGGV